LLHFIFNFTLFLYLLRELENNGDNKDKETVKNGVRGIEMVLVSKNGNWTKNKTLYSFFGFVEKK
jgi:hypothetical protein